MKRLADIDPIALPRSALIDSSVVIPGFGTRVRQSDDPASRLFCEAMIQHKRLLLIAAPTLAEFLRAEPKSLLPRTRAVQIVALDERAATILGTRFSTAVLSDLKRDKSLGPADYIKYDTMISACAIRHRAAVLVTSDAGQARVARAAGIVVEKPSKYLLPPAPPVPQITFVFDPKKP